MNLTKCKTKNVAALIVLTAMIFFNVSMVAVNAFGADSLYPVFYTYGDMGKVETKIVSTRVSGIVNMSLPSTVSAENVVLYCDYSEPLYLKGAVGSMQLVSGQPINLHSLCYPGDYTLYFTDNKENSVVNGQIKITFLKNIPAMYLSSSDPVNNGREWVESSTEKNNKATGSMLMQRADGQVVYGGELTQIKGRGNTTWGLSKKPYQIKLAEKADLLETGDGNNKSKTWVLLANFLDPAGVRNSLALNLGSELNMPVNIQSKSVDLYYDGEYRGLYMLSEKVEVGSGRVNVTNLEDENQAVNEGIDIESLPVSFGITKNGAIYTYCDGMNSPSDVSGGYLLEMDYEVRALEEVCYFKTRRGFHVVVKSPEYASKEEMDYIAKFYQEYEDALFSGGTNPSTGKKFSDYVDVRSVACYYLVNELSKARDCFLSSAYLHKKAGEDKLYMGPLWDYDMSFGRGTLENDYYDDSPYGISLLENQMCKVLLGNNEFYSVVKSVYLNEMYPLIRNVILGDSNAIGTNGVLKSLAHYREVLSESGKSNVSVWYDNENWETDINAIYEFVDIRSQELKKYFESSHSILYLPENSYYDVAPGDWYYDSVTKASEMGILKGMNYGFFGPHNFVTRAQTVQALYNKVDAEPVPYVALFRDVGAGDWFSQAVMWARNNYLIYPDAYGAFKPNDRITREEFVGILYLLSGSPEITTNWISYYYDGNKVTSKKAVEWAIASGIIQGSGYVINPTGYMTRAEFATMLVRYYGYQM